MNTTALPATRRESGVDLERAPPRKLAFDASPWPHFEVSLVHGDDPLRSLLTLAEATAARLAATFPCSDVAAAAKSAVRYLAAHSGVPAALVAALLLSVGYRVLKKSARFLVEVAAVSLALVAATELGWIRC